LQQSDRSLSAKVNRAFKKLIDVSLSPETIRGAVITLQGLKSPIPNSLTLNERLQAYDKTGILAKKQSPLKNRNRIRPESGKFVVGKNSKLPPKNDFQARLENQKIVSSWQRLGLESQAAQIPRDVEVLNAQVLSEKPSSSSSDLKQEMIDGLPHKQTKSARKQDERSRIFAEGFSSNPRKLSPLQKMQQGRLTLAQTSNKDSFSNGLTPTGLSVNHEELSQNIQEIEIKTRLRRAQHLYSSEVLGDSYKYSQDQLERKAPRHLIDYGISTEGKTIEEMAIEYKDLVEGLLSKSDLVIHEDGTLSKQEPTINIGDPELLGIAAFENNPLYEDHHFITSYPISKEAFEKFTKTGIVGSSPAEKAEYKNKLQKKRAQEERERRAEGSFYSSLPEDARIGNHQLREAEALKQKLMKNPVFPLTEKQNNLLERAEKYQQCKDDFYQNHPEMEKDEL